MNSPSGIAHISNSACGVTIKKCAKYIKTFAVFRGYMNTGLVVPVRRRKRSTEITDKMNGKLVQQLRRFWNVMTNACESCKAMERCVVLANSKQADVGASAVQSIEDFDRGIWYRDTVVDGTPSFQIRYIYKNRSVVQWGRFE